ncbi:hypothetical protein B0H13DRAFT_2659738 [Mycena leptocephala]|nr:hypothetical protein B0H13DRAFT_2659738 [Mycena leptocephala]
MTDAFSISHKCTVAPYPQRKPYIAQMHPLSRDVSPPTVHLHQPLRRATSLQPFLPPHTYNAPFHLLFLLACQRPHSSPSLISPRPRPAHPIHRLFTAAISARGLASPTICCVLGRSARSFVWSMSPRHRPLASVDQGDDSARWHPALNLSTAPGLVQAA